MSSAMRFGVRISVANQPGALVAAASPADRHAAVFVFAWHPRTGDDADPTDPMVFCLVAEDDLPRQQKTIRRTADDLPLPSY
ncbi:MAG: hypothetical protein ACOCYE_05415 [Pseudomonadota bacterium]